MSWETGVYILSSQHASEECAGGRRRRRRRRRRRGEEGWVEHNGSLSSSRPSAVPQDESLAVRGISGGHVVMWQIHQYVCALSWRNSLTPGEQTPFCIFADLKRNCTNTARPRSDRSSKNKMWNLGSAHKWGPMKGAHTCCSGQPPATQPV